MPFITIRYGPYLAYGIIDHRVQKVTGLFTTFNDMGYEIELVQINTYNRLSIELYDREVFRCDIRNLMFNMPVEDDPVCQKAVKAVEEAKFRMCTHENVPRFSSLSKGTRDLQPDFPISLMQNALPSEADLLFEIPVQPQHPLTKPKSSTDTNKNEEKVGKVTIMEENNIIRMSKQENKIIEKNDSVFKS